MRNIIAAVVLSVLSTACSAPAPAAFLPCPVAVPCAPWGSGGACVGVLDTSVDCSAQCVAWCPAGRSLVYHPERHGVAMYDWSCDDATGSYMADCSGRFPVDAGGVDH